MEEKERQRKEFKHGMITQKMMSFKVDLDLCDWLKTVANKGRLINQLLRQYRDNQADCAIMPTDREDYEP